MGLGIAPYPIVWAAKSLYSSESDVESNSESDDFPILELDFNTFCDDDIEREEDYGLDEEEEILMIQILV
ncbi:533_t:CDS:2 [Entrophospora sp. SA101]|nr:533_t:CDS:2 [Entrophospora sp. SA101]